MDAPRSRLAASQLLSGGGLLAVDQPREQIHDLLKRAGVPATDEHRRALRDLVLTAPGLDRLASGVLLDPATLRATGSVRSGTPPDRRARHRWRVGVRMGVRTVSPFDGHRAGEELAAYAAEGASFARCRMVAEGGSNDELPSRARQAAGWAAACLRAGLVPLVDATVRSEPRYGFEQAEEAQATTVGAVVAALAEAGVDAAATVLMAGPVRPGRRCSQAAAPEDVARATIRSLDAAGVAGAVAGVVFTSSARPDQLAAQLAAMQWMHPGWPIAFCLGHNVLTGVAAVWCGRPGRVAAAQRELLSRLSVTAAVLRSARSDASRPGAIGPPRADGATAAVG